jgi:hypothetical protein
MQLDDFKRLLNGDQSDVDVCRKYLFSSDVWLFREKKFENPANKYDELKLFFADRLSLSNSNVGVVGSAKTGFSLHPTKNFRSFDNEHSDIDIVLISDRYFLQFWGELLQFYYSAGTYVSSYEIDSVFRKFISLKRDNSYPSEAMRSWNQKMDAMKSDFFTDFQIANKLTYRIYQSWEAVEQYHVSSIAKLRTNLRGQSDANAE